MATCSTARRRSPMCWCCRGSSPATASRCRSKRRPRISCSISRALRAGAVYLPLNTAYTLAELDYFIGDAEPKLDRLRSGTARRASRQSQSKRGVRAVETLDASGQGSLIDGRGEGAEGLCRRAARGRRSRRHSLHVRHDRPFQGRDADASQSRLQRADADGISGASPPRTCCCTRCRSITRMACSWPATRVMLAGGSMIFLPKFDADEVMRAVCRRQRR